MDSKTVGNCLRLGAAADLSVAFDKIDLNGDGTISRDELQKYIVNALGNPWMKEFDALFDAIDIDRNGAIDLSEFSQFAEKIKSREAIRGCMKFKTQAESISSCPRPERSESEPSVFPRRRFGRRDPTVSQSMTVRATRMFANRAHQPMLRSSLTGVDLEKYLDDTEHKSQLMEGMEQREISVRFFDVEVREYGVTASDNPCVSAGAALELNWDFDVLPRMHLDTFEEKRLPLRAKNFSGERRLSRIERQKILMSFGVTAKEIQEAAKRATIIRNKRMRSIGSQHLDAKHEKMEKMRDVVKRKLGIKRKDSMQEEELLDLERLHPTLMAMMGMDEINDAIALS